MKILYLCHRIPYPLNKGDKIRAFHQVRHLAQRHEVHLYTLADTPSDLEHVDFLQSFCRKVEVERLSPLLGRARSLLGLFSSKPLTLAYFQSPALMDKVKRACTQESFHVAVAYSSSMVPYLSPFKGPRAIDFVDLDSQKWLQFARSAPPPLRWIYALEGRRLFSYEMDVSTWAEASIVVTEEEGRVLRERGTPRRLEAVSLGVDLDFYHREMPPEPKLASRSGPILIFVGNMDYRPNYEAVLRFSRNVFPSVRERVPDAVFLVVGANPPREVRELSDGRSILVTGKVPDTRPYLRAATLAVVPLFMARGIQTKVLESMAMGLPVVLTAQTSNAIGALSGRDYIVTETDEAMTRSILALLNHPEQMRAMGEAARNFVKEHFAWKDKLLRYEKILEEIAHSPTENGEERKRELEDAPSGT